MGKWALSQTLPAYLNSDNLHFQQLTDLSSAAIEGFTCAQKDTYNVPNIKNHKIIVFIS